MADRYIKAMGSSHVHILKAGEDFDGRFPDGLPEDLVFDQSNKWVINVGSLDPEAQELLAADPSFLDVTGMKRVPDNEHQKMFHPRQEASAVAVEEIVVDPNASETLEDVLTPPEAEGDSEAPAEAASDEKPKKQR